MAKPLKAVISNSQPYDQPSSTPVTPDPAQEEANTEPILTEAETGEADPPVLAEAGKTSVSQSLSHLPETQPELLSASDSADTEPDSSELLETSGSKEFSGTEAEKKKSKPEPKTEKSQKPQTPEEKAKRKDKIINRILIFLILLLIPLLILLGYECRQFFNPNIHYFGNLNTSKISQEKESYENKLKEISFAEALSKIERKEDAVIYFGFNSCPWCREAEPVLKNAYNPSDVPLYKVRTRDDNKNLLYSETEKEKLIELAGKFMESNDEGETTLYVPFIIRSSKDGITKGHVGTTDGYDAHETTMNEAQMAEFTLLINSFFA